MSGLLQTKDAFKGLVQRFAACPQIARYGSEEPETLAHAISDLEESLRKFLDGQLPSQNPARVGKYLRERTYLALRRPFSRSLLIFLLAVFLGQADVAQQSYRSYQQLSGRMLKSAGKSDKKASASHGTPMRFKRWNHPGKFRPDYLRRFSRPRARATRAEFLKNAMREAPHTSGSLSQFAPSALPGLLLRDSLPAGFIPTSVATGDFNADGKADFVVANGGDNNLWLYFGKGDGTFNLPIILPVTLGVTPTWVATADLRSIGRTDLIVAARPQAQELH